MTTSYLKKLVSKKKRRYEDDGFDLDLSYIKPNIVAMGFPSDKIEGVYRNHIDEILKFLETKHKDHYKVYNLCSERRYDPAKFKNNVADYPFDDHNAPPFQLMQPYCEDMNEFLTGDESNVAIVHCKAGKGRTGVMICAYLLHKNYFNSVQEALEYYADARTSNKKGVTIPSQRRYVHYYGHFLKHSLVYTPTTLLVTRFEMETVPSVNNGTCAPFFYVWQSKVKIYSSKSQESASKGADNICFNLPQPLPVCGDIKVQFFNKDRFGKKDLMFQFWFNTFFVSGLTPPPSEGEATMKTSSFDRRKQSEDGATSWFELHKEDLDKANKDKKNKIYSPNFKVKVLFLNPDSADEMSRKRVQSEDLASSSDDVSATKCLKRYSYDCAIHLDEMPVANNNEAVDSSNENLSETDSENEGQEKEAGAGNKNYRKETYI
ncbi:phosphatidylinositol 3,4,5-trisphosphate 3-phosphatase and dual-specificity protein phosphatase PTEN-like isoform X2 [Dendronephthya gigantea]|uniref:phosphatidylinositol 3,4,5-trisphosphate 3-phosphatase and dual-specificity protein phosphatase PTEN-like isoform X2 n=1 Tax=Dendronephthya gigantea TaxID=151771 RepID=UPI00106ACABA|nr:phosphatidylinositol 3,4,5-trisphosphate 3-phosphatase and dual-specificity protein phosphatase PTEN-like isoform X2 [Dendronephthya gigantea]